MREADGYEFSSATFSLAMGDHAGTHVDAPVHFDDRPGCHDSIDQMPLENFFTEAVCLDLSHKPLKSDIRIADLEEAERAAGVDIKPRDTVLLHMDFYRRTHGTEGFITDFPGLTKESATWLGRRASACSASRRSVRAGLGATISRCTTSAATSASPTWRGW